MSTRFDMAESLVVTAREQLEDVKKEYQLSLNAKTIAVKLQISIKNLLENLRSALDYCAREVEERCVPTQPPAGRVYFPIAKRGSAKQDFRSLIGSNLPGLLQARSDVVDLLAAFQEFSSQDNDWLPDLATLCNENKHEQLTPQVRRESRQLQIESDGVSISLGEGAQISMGSGTAIQMGRMTIPGGQTFGPRAPPRVSGPGKVKDVVWVSFAFAAISRSVLPFLEQAIAGVEKILNTIRSTMR